MSIKELVKLATNPSFKVKDLNLELVKPMGFTVKDAKSKVQEIRDKRQEGSKEAQ